MKNRGNPLPPAGSAKCLSCPYVAVAVCEGRPPIVEAFATPLGFSFRRKPKAMYVEIRRYGVYTMAGGPLVDYQHKNELCFK